MYYIILITSIKCYRIEKDGQRDSVCGAGPMNFGKAFKGELTFKLTLEKSLDLCQTVDGKCEKGAMHLQSI